MTDPSTLLERRHGEDPPSAFADPRMHLEYLLNSRALEDYAPHHLRTHHINNASSLLPVPPLPISVFQDPYNRPHPLLLSDSTPQPVMSPRCPPLLSSTESPRPPWQEPMVISSPTLPLYNTQSPHKRRGREKKEKHQERKRNEEDEEEETEEEEEGAGTKHARTGRRRSHVEGEGSEEGEFPKISVFLPPRKRRKRLSASQRTALEAAYAVQRHPSRQEKERMAQELGLSVAQVQAWYVNAECISFPYLIIHALFEIPQVPQPEIETKKTRKAG